MSDKAVVDFYDPRTCFCRFFCPTLAIWAWQGCDDPAAIIISAFLCTNCAAGWLYSLLLWSPGPQKIFAVETTDEPKYLCCFCHPKDQCCRFWFPVVAVFTWQGCDGIVDLFCAVSSGIVPFLGNFYVCLLWGPGDSQKMWGGEAVVGAPVVASTNYGATEEAK
ncbi:unnamed protein product [Amoebophrya sp. A120]|nr:unnamed protein product [Amoebophrya sp. A120]|eukprot:GSA120T00015797001.1